MKEIWFVTSSADKFKELNEIVQSYPSKEKPVFRFHSIQSSEIQTEDMEKLIKFKALEAFKKIKRPLLVEHTSLHLREWGDLPGGLTQIIWSKLDEDKFIELVGTDRRITARTYLGYIDGKKIHTYVGEIKGKLAKEARGDNGFGWDRVFIPKKHRETLAELSSEEKNDISMRKKAVRKFLKDLQSKGEI
ncbi:non-canonical purine NTP pyrophosphatase [Paenibacillus sp. FSL R5-0473]|uniref:non-canonical purine NTP pyrophosphatase n=1 Tax=Paenibacillus sp. FSL R5-0473 TaxID=2921642 RepID=UPI0030F68E24